MASPLQTIQYIHKMYRPTEDCHLQERSLLVLVSAINVPHLRASLCQHYREFLWTFVNKGNILHQWRSARGEREIDWTRTAPFRDRVMSKSATSISVDLQLGSIIRETLNGQSRTR